MSGRRFKVGPRITVQLHNEAFRELRKTSRLETLFRVRGDTWTHRLNAELHEAQAKRGQPVEDGYTYHVHQGETRVRLYVMPFTARAAAHERKHSSILKLMETTRYEVKTRAELTATQRGAEAHSKAAAVAGERARARDLLERRRAGER